MRKTRDLTAKSATAHEPSFASPKTGFSATDPTSLDDSEFQMRSPAGEFHHLHSFQQNRFHIHILE